MIPIRTDDEDRFMDLMLYGNHYKRIMNNWKYFGVREDWKKARWGYLGLTGSTLFTLANPTVVLNSRWGFWMAVVYLALTAMFFLVLGPLSRYIDYRRREFADANRRAHERASFGAGQNPP